MSYAELGKGERESPPPFPRLAGLQEIAGISPLPIYYNLNGAYTDKLGKNLGWQAESIE